MSLKYRLIVLTVTVFAVTFGVAALLGVRGAQSLAVKQLRRRLERTADALGRSGVALNDQVLSQLAPLLDAGLMVCEVDADRRPRLLYHSAQAWPWERLAEDLAARSLSERTLSVDGLSFYFGENARTDPATGKRIYVLALADESAVRGSTRIILKHYLLILAATTVLLAAGTYLVGMAMVRRINRLARAVDKMLAEDFVGPRRRGDELARLSAAFDDLRGRLDRSRERLARQQRLATVGKLASSITHEVRNPLQAIRLTVQMLADKVPPADRGGLDVIVNEIDRLSLLTDELLVLAGKDTHRPEAVDLAARLQETHRLLAHQLKQRDLRMDIELPELPAVRMDRNRCRQLLLNLLLNAAEASPRAGAIRVEGEVSQAGVTIRISDDGPGFPEDVLAERPEELFSTKSTGAGLGLSICRRIVAEAGGELRLYNTDRGAVAEAVLPLSTNSTN